MTDSMGCQAYSGTVTGYRLAVWDDSDCGSVQNRLRFFACIEDWAMLL